MDQPEESKTQVGPSSPSSSSTPQPRRRSLGSGPQPQLPPQTPGKPVDVAPPAHPGMMLLHPVDPRAEENTERIRGGCCICPSGGIWVCRAGATDDEQVEQAQRVLQQQEAEASRPQVHVPLQSLPPSQSSAGPSRETRRSKATEPSRSTPTPPEQTPKPGKRQPAKTLPPQVRPELPQFPRQAAGARTQSLSTRPAPNLP